MSKTGCCPKKNDSSASSACNQRFEVMDELNMYYNERIKKIEEAGHTELLVCNLKKWIDALVNNDKVLIDTINCLENEAIQKSDKLCQLCQDRIEMQETIQKYKQEICEKTDSIKQLTCTINEQTESLNQKDCNIKRLEKELCELKQSIDKLKSQDGKDGPADSQQLNDLKKQLKSLEAELTERDKSVQTYTEQIKKLQDDLESKSKEIEDSRLNGIPYIEEDDKHQELMKETQMKLDAGQKEIDHLQSLLNEMKAAGDSSEVETLRKNLANLKRENRDMKEALTAEVCEKHDMITSLRRDTAQLEEKARQADMQAIFKDDIIKELRKEVKLARAKESFVEMLGLNEGSRVQMKSKIDSLTAELEEKQSEITSLENKLEEMNRHALEWKLGEMSLQLMDRERDMIILCNKVDYIKRYLEKLHEDEDISIKCGLKALLLELNEETEWRRKARRSVTSLGDQPESVIIINRSNSLPADSSEHIRYNGRVNELEMKLERAREEVCCLRKKLENRETEIMSIKENNCNSEKLKRIDKVLMPDSMLSLKMEEFQRFTDESNKKLRETVDNIKEHAGNLLLKEDMEELNCFLKCEQETFFKASRQLHVLLCNIKNSNQPLAMPASYKIQCLENKLKFALTCLESERSPQQQQCPDKQGKMSPPNDAIIAKIAESLKIICDLKQDAPQVADSNDPMSSASSTKMIQEIQEMIKIIQNQSKSQQSRLSATLDNQKEETGILCKKFSEVDYLLKSQEKSVNFVKDELKIALCNITQKAEKVKKQAEQISNFECSVKDISNWANQNLKTNDDLIKRVKELECNVEQIMSMKNMLEDSRKDVRSNKTVTFSKPSYQKYSQSTPELCQRNDFTGDAGDMNVFEDRCLRARELCDEVKNELENATCRICDREQKLTLLNMDISCFCDNICRMYDDLVKNSHLLCEDNEDDNNSAELSAHLKNASNELMMSLHTIKHKLMNHKRESDGFDIKGMESSKLISCKLNELEEAFTELSETLGEMKESDYIRSLRALTNESECGVDIVEETDDFECKNDSQESTSIEDLKAEIYSLNETITALQKEVMCQQGNNETLKCQLMKTREEADKTKQMMVSSLQEKCQTLEPLTVDKCVLAKLCSEHKRQNQDIKELMNLLRCKCEKINKMKEEYCRLTREINHLTSIVQQEKASSTERECELQTQNAELRKQICSLQQRLQTMCQRLKSLQEKEEQSQENPNNNLQEDYKRRLQCVQENYNTLLIQYRELEKNADTRQNCAKQIMPAQGGQNCSDRRMRACEDSTLSTRDLGQPDKYQMILKEVTHLRCELKNLCGENDRLQRDNQRLSKEHDKINGDYKILLREQQKACNARSDFSNEKENYLCELKENEEKVKHLKNDLEGLKKNNELLVLENEDLKLELECCTKNYKQIEDKFNKITRSYDCLQNEKERLQIEKEKLEKDMRDEGEKNKLLRDEECRESMTIKEKCENLKHQLKCSEFKIEELQAQVTKADKKNMESALLEADSQLLMTKSDQEWNEMYVRKCTEVMELSEEVDCLKNQIQELKQQLADRNEKANDSKKIIVMLKRTLQDYNSQIMCLKSNLDEYARWNAELKRGADVLDKNNRTLVQMIACLRKDKKELMDKLRRLQSEITSSECDCIETNGSINESKCTSKNEDYQKHVDQISKNNRALLKMIAEVQKSNENKLKDIKNFINSKESVKSSYDRNSQNVTEAGDGANFNL